MKKDPKTLKKQKDPKTPKLKGTPSKVRANNTKRENLNKQEEELC